jgi:hypothetical protein
MGEKREEEGKKKKLPYKIRRRLFFIKINRLHENPSKKSSDLFFSQEELNGSGRGNHGVVTERSTYGTKKREKRKRAVRKFESNGHCFSLSACLACLFSTSTL